MELITQNILIVDDTRFNIQIMTNMLANDYKIFYATSGKTALEIAMSERVDLILLDVIMPEMDGYEVCKKLKSDPHTQNIPIIFVSALKDVEDETKGLEMGAIDYIFKPVSPAILKMRVKNHLELKRYRDLLEQQSLCDGLTCIANRRHFDGVFEKEWRRAVRSGEALSLAFLDIDFFKRYNDYYGHLAGDDCLRQVGIVLKDSLKRASDLVARYGGEEFIIVLPSTSQAEAIQIGEKVRMNIEFLKVVHKMSEVSDYVTVSVGIATIIPEQDMDPALLLMKVDHALYQAKSKGRNRVIAV
ncbi:MAG: PleD family two-component system response regulator [Sporomusaceae bacterium]|nr:PleD family two-component system response regulator [Sporomusaceae bacterium]